MELIKTVFQTALFCKVHFDSGLQPLSALSVVITIKIVLNHGINQWLVEFALSSYNVAQHCLCAKICYVNVTKKTLENVLNCSTLSLSLLAIIILSASEKQHLRLHISYVMLRIEKYNTFNINLL